MARSLTIDKDGRLAVPEADVQRTCVEWMEATFGYRYIATNASNLTRGRRPAHAQYSLDGLFVSPNSTKRWVEFGAPWCENVWIGIPPIFVEWKRRDARTARARKDGQSATAEGLRDLGFLVILMPDALKDDPIGWFKNEVVKIL